MHNFILNSDILKNIKNTRLSIDQYIVLYSKYYHTEWIETVYKPSALVFMLLRKRGFLDNNNCLTDNGVSLVREVQDNKEEAKWDIDFEIFWSTYPSGDSWGAFPLTRKIATNKKKAKEAYLGVRSSGISQETLLNAVLAEVDFKKKTSTIKNNLTFMQSPSAWLNARTFEEWAEQTKEDLSSPYGKDLK